MEEKNGFDITKLYCGAVVKGLLERANPGDAVFCFFEPFFFLFSPCFLMLFFLSECFPLLILTQLVLTLLIMHLDHYIFSALVRSFILQKGFQELLICILAKLNIRPEKNHKLSRHFPSLNFSETAVR